MTRRADISVLVPSRNYGRFITDALSSVPSDTGPAIEIVVQDAESGDETRDVLARAPEHVLWRSEPDDGQSDALNRALERSQGDYIAWLNADEFYMPRGLSVLYEAAVQGGSDVVFGDSVFVDAAGSFVRLLPQHAYSAWLLRWYECYIQTCSLLIRKDALDSSPWNTSMRRMMDWELFLRLDAEGARFLHVPYPVGAFRLHEDQVTALPTTVHHDEYATLSSRYGLRPPRQRIVGRGVHGYKKLVGGAYRRQALARKLRGRSMRWFASTDGRDAVASLLGDIYGVDSPQGHGVLSNEEG